MKNMNRSQRRAANKHNQQRFTDELMPVPAEDWPDIPATYSRPVKVYASRKYLIQVYAEDGGVMRISVNRTQSTGSSWKENITWDELQQIKRDIGYGESYAIEVYPRDCDIVNVANMRHLWVLPEPLSIGWFNNGLHRA